MSAKLPGATRLVRFERGLRVNVSSRRHRGRRLRRERRGKLTDRSVRIGHGHKLMRLKLVQQLGITVAAEPGNGIGHELLHQEILLKQRSSVPKIP